MARSHVRAGFGVLLLLAAACGEGGAVRTASATPLDVEEPLVASGHVVVLRTDRTIATVSARGEVVSTLGSVDPDLGLIDSVAASSDGRLVLVSALRYDDDSPSTCSAQVLQVLPDRRLRRLAEGSSVALTPSGSHTAHFRYAEVDGFCRRTALVVTDLEDGSEIVTSFTKGAVAGGTPPEWPVSLSPDATQVAHVAAEGAVMTEPATGETQAVETNSDGRALAPVWLADGRLAAMHGCCIGGGAVRVQGDPDDLFPVPGPVRSLRAGRDGSGAWFTIEEQGLHHWDGVTSRQVTSDALLTSG